jgi:hypothetical protein
MQNVSKPLTNAEKLRRYNAGVATRLKRIETAVEELPGIKEAVADLREMILCVLAERQRNDPQQDARR